MLGGDDESVDVLLQKLAKKGKKIKILDEDGEEVEQSPNVGGRQTHESIAEEDNEDDGEIREDINPSNDVGNTGGSGIKMIKSMSKSKIKQ